MQVFPLSVCFHWISPHCDWRWQIWEESFNLLLYSGQQNTKHPEFYGEPDSGSPLKVCVYINCIFAEAWPSDIFPSDGHAAFYFMADYKSVTFDRCSRRPFLCPMETACFIQIVDCQAIRVFNVFPMALFLSDGHVAVYFMADYKAVTFRRCSHRPFLCPMETACFIQIVDCQAIRVFNVFPMALFLSDGHVAVYFMADYKAVTFRRCSHRPFFCPMGTEYDGATTLRKVSLLFNHPCFMPTKKNIWHSGFTSDSKHPAAQAAALTQSRHKNSGIIDIFGWWLWQKWLVNELVHQPLFSNVNLSLFLGLLFVIEVQIPFDEVVHTSLW